MPRSEARRRDRALRLWPGRQRAARILAFLLLLGLPRGAHPGAPSPSPGTRSDPDAPILVFVAASFRSAIEEVAAAHRRRGGDAVLLSAAASGVLVSQIEHGAPADLFVSAAPAEIDRLEASGLLVAGSRQRLASNQLVVALPRGAPAMAGIHELREPRFQRIAIGNPRTVPAGRHAEACLRSLGLRAELESRLILAEHVRQALDWVARGECDAAFVYRTDVALLPDRVAAAVVVDPASHPPIAYEAALLRRGSRTQSARALLDYLSSPEGLKILVGLGFAPPPPP